MTSKDQVIFTFKLHPDWTSIQIARHLHCCDAYVRATLRRNGLRLRKTKGRSATIIDLGTACFDRGLTLEDIERIQPKGPQHG